MEDYKKLKGSLWNQDHIAKAAADLHSDPSKYNLPIFKEDAQALISRFPEPEIPAFKGNYGQMLEAIRFAFDPDRCEYETWISTFVHAHRFQQEDLRPDYFNETITTWNQSQRSGAAEYLAGGETGYATVSVLTVALVTIWFIRLKPSIYRKGRPPAGF